MDQSKEKKYRKKTVQTDIMVYGKMPPQNKELESAVLGAIMLEKNAFDTVLEILKADCFYVDAHQKIFRAMQGLAAKNMNIDILTVVEELRFREEIDLVGGPYYLTKLTDSVVSSANIETHCRIIFEKYLQRELIKIGGNIQQTAYEDSANAFELVEQADKSITELTTGNLKKGYTTMESAMVKSISRIEELRALKTHITGIPTGFIDIDRITHGWQNNDLVILAARPSVGKTALALNLARNAAKTVPDVSLAWK